MYMFFDVVMGGIAFTHISTHFNRQRFTEKDVGFITFLFISSFKPWDGLRTRVGEGIGVGIAVGEGQKIIITKF